MVSDLRKLLHDEAWAESHHVQGLKAAYATDAGLVRRRNVLHFARIKSFGDVVDDLHIPFDDVVDTQRYREAALMMHGVDIVVGHSLGGSVALSLADAYGVQSVTYGAPVIDLSPVDSSGSRRHRHVGDPVALKGVAAETTFADSFNPHSFS